MVYLHIVLTWVCIGLIGTRVKRDSLCGTGMAYHCESI